MYLFLALLLTRVKGLIPILTYSSDVLRSLNTNDFISSDPPFDSNIPPNIRASIMVTIAQPVPPPSKTKKKRKGGKRRTSFMFYNVHGLNNVFRNEPNDRFFSKPCVTFLCETWNRDKDCTSHPFKNRFISAVPAVKTINSRGRPKGGLMFSVSKTLDPVVLSSSQHHIALLLQTINIAVIGCYYNPNLDFDDVTQDCLKAISSCPKSAELVIGGDWNMKPSTETFNQMELLLDAHGISCVSDNSQPTFHAPRVLLLLTMFS